MSVKKTVALKGSSRKPLQGARPVGSVSGDEPIEVAITLKAPASLEAKVKEIAHQGVTERTHMTREEFAKTYGSDDASLKRIEDFAREHNLSIKSVDCDQHTVHLMGAERDISKAFNVHLEMYSNEHGTYRGRTGSIQVPEELGDLILSVNGLDDRPVAKPRFRRRGSTIMPHAGAAITYTPQEIAALYNFPEGAGDGQCIAIIELGGGYTQQDLTDYFGGKGPQVTAVSVGKGHNKPTGDPNGPDGEVLLDIEVAGAIAPNSKIAVYFAPNTNKGFMDAIRMAVHDTVRKPSVVSISWGGPEDGGGFSPASLQAFHQVLQAAVVMGVTVFCAAGDDGSGDRLPGDHVDYPAADDLATGCGGTRLNAPSKKTISSEVVWNELPNSGSTGGGISRAFPVPDYQKGLTAAKADGSKAALTGRGVPDISGNADPVTGYDVLVDGSKFAIGGTSAVAPLMAGLVALINQKIGKPVGFLNPMIYAIHKSGKKVFRDITDGNNGTFAASTGWDACTGLGVPDGKLLLGALQGQSGKAA
jgi:kumamolisin